MKQESAIGEHDKEVPEEPIKEYKKSLVFSKILKTEAEKDDSFYFKELERLPKYVKGNRDSKGKGFRHLNENFEMKEFYLKFHSEDENNPLGKISYVNVDRILTIQYVSEKYRGNNLEPSEETVDIFWIREYDLILMNGPKKLCEDAYKEIVNIEKVKFIDIKFKHNFLLWIPYRLNKYGGKLFPELFVTIIGDGVTQNKSSMGNVPKRMVIDKSIEAILTLPAIYGLVNDHKFYSIGGDFKFRNELLKVTLSNDSIHIKINLFLKNKDHGERCAIVFPFIIEMVNVLDYWENLDDPDEKYPNEEFLKVMEDSFNAQISACQKNFKKLKKLYKQRRKAYQGV